MTLGTGQAKGILKGWWNGGFVKLYIELKRFWSSPNKQEAAGFENATPRL